MHAEDPKRLDAFYEGLASSSTTIARRVTFICGDSSSKLQAYRLLETSMLVSSHAWTHNGLGTQNSSGDCLVDFFFINGYFACNTSFDTPCRHRTTWTGLTKDKRRSTGPVKSIIRSTTSPTKLEPAHALLIDSCAYTPAHISKRTTNYSHAKVRMDNSHLLHKQKPKGKRSKKINIKRIRKNKTTQTAYQEALHNSDSLPRGPAGRFFQERRLRRSKQGTKLPTPKHVGFSCQ